jgi:hypothetical protein
VRGVAEHDQLDGAATVEAHEGGTAPIPATGRGAHREAVGEEGRHQAVGGAGRHLEVASRFRDADGPLGVGQDAQEFERDPDGAQLTGWSVCISHSGTQFDRIRGRWSQLSHEPPPTRPTHSAVKKV